MQIILVRPKKGAVQKHDISTLEEFGDILDQLGKRDKISLDGGKTFIAPNKVTDKQIDDFFEKGSLDDTNLISSKSHERTEMIDIKKVQAMTGDLEERLGELLAGSIDSFGAGILESFANAQRQIADFQKELLAQAAQTGEAHGAYERIDETLRDIAAQLSNRLSENALSRMVSSVVGEASVAIERQVSEKLEQLEAKQDRIVRQEDFLEDIVDETRDLVSRFKPGLIEALKQQLEALKAERTDLEGVVSNLKSELDQTQRENRRLLADDDVQAREEIQQKLELLNRRRLEIDNFEQLKAERDDLHQRVQELDALRERYEENQRIIEENQNNETRLREVERDYRQLEKRYQNVKRDEQALRRQIADRSTELERIREQLAEAQTAHQAARLELDAFKAQQDEDAKNRDEYLEKLQALKDDRLAFEQHSARTLEELTRQADAALEARSLKLETTLTQKINKQFRDEINTLTSQRDELSSYEEQFQECSARLRQANAEKLEWECAHDQRVRQQAILEKELQDLQETHTKLEEKVSQMEDERREILEDIGSLEGMKCQVEGELNALEAREEKRRAELSAEYRELRDRLEKQYTQRKKEFDVDRETRIKPIHSGSVELVETSREQSGLDEQQWLDGVIEQIEAADFYFPRRLIQAFHTSLKIAEWAPLTVLAGVSGTGKSELPRLYSMFGGLNHKMISVQPNWDSPQDMFGFFNYMDNRYKATEFLQALVQSQKSSREGGFEDQLLLVLLDEMNLARVELYFSEFLSKLEARRGLGGDSQRPYIGVDIGSGLPEVKVELGQNVLFVGTMNEDETTQSLSDKVLDRGNIITFPRPSKLRSRSLKQSLQPSNTRLPRETWEGWIKSSTELDSEVQKKIGAMMSGINLGLRHANRAIGHRVLQAVENYVVNHPDVRASDGSSDEPWQRALADQVVQKIMPKLRGIETDTERGRACLDEIESLISEYTPELTKDFEQAREAGYGSFIWSSAEYLVREDN